MEGQAKCFCTVCMKKKDNKPCISFIHERKIELEVGHLSLCIIWPNFVKWFSLLHLRASIPLKNFMASYRHFLNHCRAKKKGFQNGQFNGLYLAKKTSKGNSKILLELGLECINIAYSIRCI